MSGNLILFGIIFIAGGVFQFYARDWLWQSQVRANEMRGIPSSERTETWDNWRSTIGVIGVVGGIIFLALGFLSGTSAPAKPEGTYFCSPDVAFDAPDATTTRILSIRAGGTGIFDNVLLNWTYDETQKWVVFSGDGVPVSANYDLLFDREVLAVTMANGDALICRTG
jgi:hypothetical protein